MWRNAGQEAFLWVQLTGERSPAGAGIRDTVWVRLKSLVTDSMTTLAMRASNFETTPPTPRSLNCLAGWCSNSRPSLSAAEVLRMEESLPSSRRAFTKTVWDEVGLVRRTVMVRRETACGFGDWMLVSVEGTGRAAWKARFVPRGSEFALAEDDGIVPPCKDR